MSKRALITGVGGMDGSYLAEILTERGYEVHGLYRRSSVNNLQRLTNPSDPSKVTLNIILHKGDVTDPSSVHHVIGKVRPDEVYHLADQDNVDHSFSSPIYSHQVTYGGVVNVLETVRNLGPTIKVFIPISATVFGDATPPQNESTPFNPLSPYAVAKSAAYYAARYYRQVHGMFVATAILYNHDSPRRGGEYLLHRMVRAAIRVARGEQNELPMIDPDNLILDIGYAKDYMEAAHQMMQLEKPDDFVICSKVWTFATEVIGELIRLIKVDLMDRIVGDEKFDRPGPRPTLVGDCYKAKHTFSFNPQNDIFKVVGMLVEKYQNQDRSNGQNC